MRVLLALVALVALASPALAAKPQQVLILAGDTTPEKANAALAAVKAANKLVTFADGFPRIIASESMPGLKPGFTIVIAGVCTDATALGRAKEILSLATPGAYLRKVSGQTESCPAIALEKTKVPKGYSLVEARPLAAGSAITIALYTAGSPRHDCSGRSVLIRAELAKQVLAEIEHEGQCGEAPGEGDVGDYLDFSASFDAGASTLHVTEDGQTGATQTKKTRTVQLTLEGLVEQ